MMALVNIINTIIFIETTILLMYKYKLSAID